MRHLLSMEDLDREGIERILDRAKSFTEVSEREVKKVPALRGRRVLNLFYEASTRTRSSFELAAKTLSAEVVKDRKSTRLNSSHANISYAVFCLKKKNKNKK